MRMVLIVAVSVIVGIAVGYAAMTAFYGSSQPSGPAMMKR